MQCRAVLRQNIFKHGIKNMQSISIPRTDLGNRHDKSIERILETETEIEKIRIIGG